MSLLFKVAQILHEENFHEGLLYKIAAKKKKKKKKQKINPVKKNKGTLIRDTDTAYVSNAQEVKKEMGFGSTTNPVWPGASTTVTSSTPNWSAMGPGSEYNYVVRGAEWGGSIPGIASSSHATTSSAPDWSAMGPGSEYKDTTSMLEQPSFFSKHKGKLAAGALGLILAGYGYHRYKQNNQQQQQ